MLYKLLDDFEPERIAVIFDAPGKTFRDDLYKDYKANRPPMPEDLRPQIEPLLEAIKADLQLDDAQLGYLSGIAFALFYATLGIPIASLADRKRAGVYQPACGQSYRADRG